MKQARKSSQLTFPLAKNRCPIYALGISTSYVPKTEQKYCSISVLHELIEPSAEEKRIRKIVLADKFVKSLALPPASALQSPNTTDT